MPAPGELAALSAELRSLIQGCNFSFEWSSPSQGKHLLLCGDWNRQGRRTSRTLRGSDGAHIKRGRLQLSTTQRKEALEVAITLVSTYMAGGDTHQRLRPTAVLTSRKLGFQRSALIKYIRHRPGQHGVKSKHLRHATNLFDWLDEQRKNLDYVNAITWAGDGVKRDTDNYQDRVRVAQWACRENHLLWELAVEHKPLKPKVKRPFVDGWALKDDELETMFSLVIDPEVETFFRVVACMGCRPSEVFCFDWQSWLENDRPNYIDSFSRKRDQEYTAIALPHHWIKDIDPGYLTTCWSAKELSMRSEEVSADLVKRHQKLNKELAKQLKFAGFESKAPTWTDLRHLWTLRAEFNAHINPIVAANAQAHSNHMRKEIYLRHGRRLQVIAEAKRITSVERGAA